MSHRCRWLGCTVIVGNDLRGCKSHWRALPDSLREWIGRSYRYGMDTETHPTASYLRANRAAIAFAREVERGRD